MSDTVKSAGLDYAGDKISRLFCKLFFPTLLGMIFNALITIVDGVFVGQGVGPDGIAAVNIIAPLYMVTTGIGLMFGIGASVVAGIAMSQNDFRRASVSVTQGVVMAGLLIVSMCAVLLSSPTEVARLLGCSDRLMPNAIDYLLWLVPGMFFLLFQAVGMMVIRLDGSPKYAMMCNVVPAVVNIALDWYLVFPMAMGVKGAAIATSASVCLGALMVCVYFLRFSYALKICWESRKFLVNTWRQVCIGASAFITEIAMSIMMMTGNYVFLRYFGEAGVAAYSIACYLFPLIFMMSNAVAQSAQPIISYNYGAGAGPRVAAAFRVSLRVALICGFISATSIAFAARGIVSLFIDPACEAGHLASTGLPVFAVCAVFFAVNIAYIGYFQSIGKALTAAVFTLLRGVVYLVPLFLLLPRVAGDTAVWMAIPASEILTLITILVSRLMARRKKA